MEYRLFGRTGLRVSEVGFGGWALGGAVTLGGQPFGWSGTSDPDSRAAVARALELGINLFDTADVYGLGHGETLLGEALATPAGREAVVVSKVGNRWNAAGEYRKDFSPKYITQAIDDTLQRLRREVVDVYLLHSPSPGAVHRGDWVDALTALRKAGKIRYFGISLPPAPAAAEAVAAHVFAEGFPCDVFQVVYSLLEPDMAFEVMTHAVARGMAIMARSPLYSGFLTGKFTEATVFPADDHRSRRFTPEVTRETVGRVERLRPVAEELGCPLPALALKYALSNPTVHTVIPGMKSPAQVEANSAASDGRALSLLGLRKVHAALEARSA